MFIPTVQALKLDHAKSVNSQGGQNGISAGGNQKQERKPRTDEFVNGTSVEEKRQEITRDIIQHDVLIPFPVSHTHPQEGGKMRDSELHGKHPGSLLYNELLYHESSRNGYHPSSSLPFFSCTRVFLLLLIFS